MSIKDNHSGIDSVTITGPDGQEKTFTPVEWDDLVHRISKGGFMRKYFKRDLWCELTPGELEAVSQEMSAAVLLGHRIEAEKKAANDAYKERLDGLKSKIRDAATQIESGRVERAVDCFKEYDYPHGRTRVIRADTFETVEERAMTADERQRCLDETPPARRDPIMPPPIQEEESDDKLRVVPAPVAEEDGHSELAAK